MNSLQASKQISCIDLYNNLTGQSYSGHGNVKCINPMHEDNNASMQLTHKSFKCFACNVGGSVVDLYAFSKSINLQHNKSMLYKLSDELCDLFKIKYDKKIINQDQQAESYYTLMDTYVKISKYYLRTEAGIKPIEYLNKRNFTNDFIQANDIGFNPKPFTQDGKIYKLFDLLKTKLNIELMEQYGLVNNGNINFENRIILPIYDDYGRIVALAGRSNGAEPKYLLLKSNKYWEKHKLLYNWHQAGGYSKLIIVEGFMDALSFLQAGIHNVVSLMGLSLTEEHYKKLQKKQLILALDNDKAGHDAMYNIITKYPDLNIWIPNWYLPRQHQQRLIEYSKMKDANDLFIYNKESLKDFTFENTISKYEYLIRYYKYYKGIDNQYNVSELRNILVDLLKGKDKTTIDFTKKIFNRMLGIKEEN